MQPSIAGTLGLFIGATDRFDPYKPVTRVHARRMKTSPCAAGLGACRTQDARSRWLGLVLMTLAVAGDRLSLAVVAPFAATAGILALRRGHIGALVGFAPAAYAVCMVPQYVLGPGLRAPSRSASATAEARSG